MTSNYESRKGTAFKFVGGIHAGSKGWVDKTKDATNEFIYVLVRQKNKKDGSETIIKSRVKHEN